MAHMKKNVPRKNNLQPHPPDAALSSTMRIPSDALVDLQAEMHLDIRCPDNKRPCRIVLGKGDYAIGRHPKAAVPVMLPVVSRRHAHIFSYHEEAIIEDLNSTNGTFVNGVRISRCVLQNNDVIRIGDATLLFSRTKRKEF